MDEMKGSEIATSTSCTRAQRTNQQAPKPQTLTEFCVKRTSSAPNFKPICWKPFVPMKQTMNFRNKTSPVSNQNKTSPVSNQNSEWDSIIEQRRLASHRLAIILAILF